MLTEGSESPPSDGVRASVRELKESVAADWYEPETFIPWSDLEAQLSDLDEGITALQMLCDAGAISITGLAQALAQHPSVLDALRVMLVAPRGAGFVDGRTLPTVAPSTTRGLRDIASLVKDLGIGRLLPPGTDVRSVARAALVAIDARRRGFRRGADLVESVGSAIRAAIRQVRLDENLPVELARPNAFDLPSRFDAVLSIDGRPFAAIQSVFQVSSGGRQQRDLNLTYPELQRTLRERAISLILIIDGAGIKQTPDRVLETLVASVSGCMTLSQARSGLLADVVLQAARAGVTAVPLRTLIESQLRQEGRISADLLPSDRESSLRALARFVDQSPDLALYLDSTKRELLWPRVLDYRRSSDVRPTLALAEALGVGEAVVTEEGSMEVLTGRMLSDRVLPATAYIGTTQSVDQAVIRLLSRKARNAGAKIAILVSPEAEVWRRSAEAAEVRRELATSVVVIDFDDVVDIIGAKTPRDAIVKHVLAQADLSKANPYSEHGVTRETMFFGRDAELAEIRATLETNSIAVLGGRRIGKTSLLNQTLGALRGQRWSPTIVDCQAAGDWPAFAELFRRHDVTLPEAPSARAVTSLVDQLTEQAGGRRPVLILDEVDNLLRWDMSNEVDGVTEIVFRAFRAASQEDRVRFVFSGERLIFERLSDPSSPHWNFCRPLAVRQLSARASAELFETPLRELGVTLEDRDEILKMAWDYTQGHPQIIQHLGSSIVQILNARSPQDRALLLVDDVREITGTTAFADHYVSTYWGQATREEKLITCLISVGVNTPEELRAHVEIGQQEFLMALRMLELYGVLEGVEPPYRFRTSWFPTALEKVGDIHDMTRELRSQK